MSTKNILGIVALTFVALPLVALAAENYVPLAPNPFLDTSADTSLSDYINSFFLLTISVAAMLAVLRIAIGGFKYMTRTGSVNAAGEARKTIQGAVVGLLLLLGVVVILSTINEQILSLDALKFTRFAPDAAEQERVGSADEALRAQKEEARKKREASLKSFAAAGDSACESLLDQLQGKSFRCSTVDVAGLSSKDETAYREACHEAGNKIEKSVIRSCKRLSDGTIVERSAVDQSPIAGIPVIGGALENAAEFIADTCRDNEQYVPGSKREILWCKREI